MCELSFLFFHSGNDANTFLPELSLNHLIGVLTPYKILTCVMIKPIVFCNNLFSWNFASKTFSCHISYQEIIFFHLAPGFFYNLVRFRTLTLEKCFFVAVFFSFVRNKTAINQLLTHFQKLNFFFDTSM